MKDDFRNRKVITHRQAVRYLADPLRLRFFSPFIGRERAALEVARELNLPLSTLLYQIDRMIQIDLLKIIRIKKRSGSPIKYYRAVADAFFVPFEATDADSLETLLKAWEEPWLSTFHQAYAQALMQLSSSWGIAICREGKDIRVVPAPTDTVSLTHPPALLDELVVDLQMSDTAARALQNELLELIDRYRNSGGMKRYFLRIMLTPSSADKVLR
jgi:hypothetical protein